MFRKAFIASTALVAVNSQAFAATPAHVADGTATGTVNIGGVSIPYRSVVGTLLIHDHGYNDSAEINESRTGSKQPPTKQDDDKSSDAIATMSYVAYFRQGAQAEHRPITFVYNGGPGSATVWLHMGSFGPVRLNTPGDLHLPPAPYRLVNNGQSLLDATDLVFIDAPGTGFGRVSGKDHDKAFFGVDADGHAFADFIARFLAKYGRYNSPKYLFGESYGTMRSAVVVNDLQNDENIDFNGVILLSQILNYDNNIDDPHANPGIDEPYELALPTYAATAWYHHKLPQPQNDLPAFLKEVEQFATTDYATALNQGADLPEDRRRAIANTLHDYTGLPVSYILRADLRITGGQFSKMLQQDDGITTGRLDTRFSGPDIDPISEEAEYDPQSTALSSAYISAFNDYVRHTLHYSGTEHYVGGISPDWDFRHRQPDMGRSDLAANVMPDLAYAMKTNPRLHVMLNSGYYDLATPFYEGIFEMKHLPIPRNLQGNIEYKQYRSGHMVYVDPAALQQLHDNIADFIHRTNNQ